MWCARRFTLADMNDFAELDEMWRDYFPSEPPARVVVPMGLVLPDMKIEIEVIAVDPKGPYRKEIVTTSKAPQSLSPEPQAVKAGPYLFLSGQMATDYVKGIPAEAQPDPNFPFHASPVQRQVQYIYKNVEAICKAAGTSPRNLLKRSAYYQDLKDMPVAERVWQRSLQERIPPTSHLAVPGSLPVPGCRVQYDLIALVPQ